MLSLLLLLPLLSHADDIRSFSPNDMAELSGKIGKSLKKCKELANGAAVEIAFTNATSESIDKDAFGTAIQSQLTPGGTVPGRKYDLELKLLSTSKQTGTSFEGTYTLNAHLKQADEVLCMKTAKIVKKGKITK